MKGPPVGSEMDDIKKRVSSLEVEQASIREQAEQGKRAAELYAAVDRDVADIKTAFNQQRQVLNAMGQTQAEHTIALRQQGEVLGGLVIEVARHGHVLDQHTQTLDQHTQTLDQHTQTLDQHTQVLNEHTQMLTEHTEMLTEQKQMLGEILDRLPAKS